MEEIEKKNWFSRHTGLTFLVVLIYLTAIGILTHKFSNFADDYMIACLASYGVGICLFIWGVMVYLFVTVAKGKIGEIMLSILVAIVWFSIGIVINLIWHDIFWAIFGLPIVGSLIFLFFGLCAVAAKESENSNLPSPPL